MCVVITLSNDATMIATKSGNSSNMSKHLTTQHVINLHECNVLDMLLRDGADSKQFPSLVSF